LRSIDRFVDLDGLRRELYFFYSMIGRPSIPRADDQDAAGSERRLALLHWESKAKWADRIASNSQCRTRRVVDRSARPALDPGSMHFTRWQRAKEWSHQATAPQRTLVPNNQKTESQKAHSAALCLDTVVVSSIKATKN
jgi:hypothetical protein